MAVVESKPLGGSGGASARPRPGCTGAWAGRGHSAAVATSRRAYRGLLHSTSAPRGSAGTAGRGGHSTEPFRGRLQGRSGGGSHWLLPLHTLPRHSPVYCTENATTQADGPRKGEEHHPAAVPGQALIGERGGVPNRCCSLCASQRRHRAWRGRRARQESVGGVHKEVFRGAVWPEGAACSR